MLNYRNNPRKFIGVAIAAALLSACGGGGGSDAGTGGTGGGSTSAPIAGTAVDFYLSGATVTFTGCSNATATTDANGKFTAPAGCSNSAFTVTGGTDIATGLPFTGVLQAPAQSAGSTSAVIASPLTTLIAQNPAGAAKIMAALGLSSAGDPLTVDPTTNAKALQAAETVQQLVTQVSNILASLSKANSGGLTPAQAAQAALGALVNSISNSSSSAPFSLTNVSNIQSVISGAVVNAYTNNPTGLNLPAGASIAAYSSNIGALTAASVANQTAAVSTAMANITIGGSPADTLAALKASGVTATIGANTSSTSNGSLIAAIPASILTSTDPSIQSNLAQLGTAFGSGSSAAVTGAVTQLNNNPNLPAGASISATAVATSVQKTTITNYIQLAGVTLNNGSALTLDQVQGSVVTGQELTAKGGVSDIKIALNAVGTPYTGSTTSVNAGFKYVLNGNEVDVIINNVQLTFGANGNLTAATVPAGASYSFNVSGAATASVSLTNKGADNLFSGGSVDLSVATFLSKLTNAAALTSAQTAAYTPKVGDKVTTSFNLASSTSSPLGVGIGAAPNGVAAPGVSITAGSTTLTGSGINAVVVGN